MRHTNPTVTPRFRDIRFGYASAEEEGANDPSLLLEGFYDPDALVTEVLDGSRYLFLGYKGSGKSAVGEHLRLLAQPEPELFVTPTFLGDFPFSDFKKIVTGDDETRYPTAWSWLLLLCLFGSFSQDSGSPSLTDTIISEIVTVLTNSGLLPAPTFREIALVTSKRSFKLALPGIAETLFERTSQQQQLQIPTLVQWLRKGASEFRSSSSHIIVIDGLDDILTTNKIQYETLAALILEVARLNQLFRQNQTPAKILVLCRTDLFERLPGPNKNKIRQDSAVELDWYHDPRNPSESNLIRLANKRAQLTDTKLTNIFEQFFPPKIDDEPIEKFLLDLTRHTPRDFLQLLKHIQRFSTGFTLNRTEIMSGLRDYSIKYFLPEIKDELVGYVGTEQITLMLDLLGAVRKRDFSFAELEAKASSQTRFESLIPYIPQIITALFECSAIGNVQHRPGGTTFYTFRYRNRHSSFNPEDGLILHRGLWKALNLI